MFRVLGLEMFMIRIYLKEYPETPKPLNSGIYLKL